MDQPVKGTTAGEILVVGVGGGTVDGFAQEIEPRRRYLRGQRSLVLLGESGISPDGTRLWPVNERDIIDASGIATDEFYPNRRWAVAERLRQIQTVLGVAR